MLDRFSKTVDLLYSAAVNDCPWGTALAGVEQLTGSAGAVVHIVPKSESGTLKTLLGESADGLFIADHVAEWTRDYAPLCPRLAAATRWPDAPYYVDHMLLSEREMDRDPVYSWYGAHGLRYFIFSRLCHTDDVEIVWSLQRRREQGHAQASDIELFELLKPHLARSLALAEQLGTLRSDERFSSAMLEALPQAVFALDAEGMLRFANGSGARLLAKSDGLALEAGRLQVAAHQDQQRLDSMIRSAIAPLDAPARAWTRVARPSGRLPFAVFVAPLNVADEEIAATNARVLVLVHDTGELRCAGIEMLTDLYGLTQAEARLASALSGGHSVESAAALLHMQPATARSHLKSVFRKTGVNRQQDLVRLLASLSSLSPAT